VEKMKYKSKQLLSALLAAALVFCLLAASPMTVYADWAVILEAEIESFKVFQEVNTYTSGQFNDVRESAWYSGVAAKAYEYGLMKGTGANTFNPSGNMTVAEAVTIAARVHNIYHGGNGEFVQGDPWYQVYVDYAIDNGIITAGAFSNYNKAATRAEMAYIFARTSVPVLLAYTAVHDPPNIVNSLPDADSSTRHYDYIIRLYQAGILAGSDAQGTFHPNSSVTRAEAAAIIIRLIILDERISGRTYG